jgi:predicted outer membrane repeat protein
MLSGLTISNGNASFGGGIQNYRSALTISNCVISGNQATFGAGGILSSSGYSGTATLTIINSALHRNFGGDVGGAIYQDGQDGDATLVLINSTINSNWVGTVGGAGIKNDGSPTGNAIAFITNCTFIGNSAAGRGGAIQNDGVGGSVSLTVVNTTFIGNSAGGSDYGGAIFNDGSSHGHADATFINTTFSGNSAFLGGAICDSFIFGTGNMPLTLISCTFKDNLSTNGGSIYNLDKLTIGNTILSAGISGTSISGSTNVISMGYNLSSDSANGVLTNVTDQINTDPLLSPLQDNGGPVLTHAPLPGSPAIDKGKNLSEAIIDARGFPRMFDDPAVLNANGGDGTDIGAFETFELRITAIEKVDEHLGIGFTSLPGKTYELQSRSDLNSPTWTPLPGSYPGNGAIAQITLTNSPGQPQQYYRVHQLP